MPTTTFLGLKLLIALTLINESNYLSVLNPRATFISEYAAASETVTYKYDSI
jgi:hypothetical protein